MLKGIDLDFRHDDGVIVRGNGAVFGVVRCAKCPKCTPERCSGPRGVQNARNSHRTGVRGRAACKRSKGKG